MAGLLSVEVTGATDVRDGFAQLQPAARMVLMQAVALGALKLQRHIVENKLSGQVLNVRTGALRRSIEMKVDDQGDQVVGTVYSSGDVKYAAIHEFGFAGQETVRQHIRTMCFGRTVEPFSVGPYVRQVNMPERSFMRSALADLRDELVLDVADAMQKLGLSGISAATFVG